MSASPSGSDQPAPPVRGHEGDTFTGPSFSFGNRLGRAAWKLVWLLLARWSPAPVHAWRALLLRLFGARLGRHVHVYPGVEVWAPWNLTCGDFVGIGNRAIIYNQAPITLGNRVVISQGAHLCTGTHDYESHAFQLYAKPITVADHGWLAAECFVGPGVAIGEGAVVGARAVVMKDVAPWLIVRGNPAAPVRTRRGPADWR